MKTFFRSITLMLVLCFPAIAADKTPLPQKKIIQNVFAEGSCAVVGMSAEQSQLIALQRARATAIEKAAGITVSSSTLVTDFRLAADFIKTYAKGFIVKEAVEWLPLGQYQKDKKSAPIPEYHVKITADVYVPEMKIKPLNLKASLNKSTFRAGEHAQLEIKTGRPARVAVFNITAADEAVMLFPNELDARNLTTAGTLLKFPDKNSPVELVMNTLPGHNRDAEAFFVAAMDASSEQDFNTLFTPGKPMPLDRFFAAYAAIADQCEDTVVVYEVVSK